MSHQQTIASAATAEDNSVTLSDQDNITLREGDVLTSLRTKETLLITGIDKDRGAVAFYSNHEGAGHHQLKFIPTCFDFVIQNNGKRIQTVELKPSD